MTYKKYLFEDIDAVVQVSEFGSGEQTDELHAIVQAGGKYPGFDDQLSNLKQAVRRLKSLPGYESFNLVFKRYFLSDAANQADFIEHSETSESHALSIVQQPPLNGTKVALWAYFLKEPVRKEEPATSCVEKNGYKHRWTTLLRTLEGNTNQQTEAVFGQYSAILQAAGMNMKDHCVRIWLFVQNVDVNYADVVSARKPCFDREGMNERTHYLSSTGIEGRSQYHASVLLADAYSVDGLSKGQVSFLYAPFHLSPTTIYGVHFERGTAVIYGDRRHVFISGTASIDREGKIVHPNQIELQTQRTLENIKALLQEAGAGFGDVAQLIVYLRDTADYALVNDYLESRYPDLPKVLVWAPVCRPGWLIEMECMAVVKCSDKRFRDF